MPKPIQASSYTFRTLIEGGYLYVDKTRTIYELVRGASGIYFLSRPRRFGKSLLISTLEEIFLGNQELFRGLWLYESDYDWPPHPIVRIDFSWHTVKDAETLKLVIDSYVEEIAESYGLTLKGFDFQSRFRNLLLQLSKKAKIVILIDEYDKPLVDNLENLPEAVRIRDVLKSFYTVIKAMDRYLRFVFITGISKFSRVGIFSSLNNLDDLTFDKRFATLLGLTEEELRQNFQEHIQLFAEQEKLTTEALFGQIRIWYDGFCFTEESPNLYNPFSTLLLLNKQRFANYWFESGTPTFLIKLLKEQQYPVEALQELRLNELAFSTYELENLSIVPLLFQTGYLTIKAYDPATRTYTLSYPNREVEDAFTAYLLGAFSEGDRSLNEEYLWQLVDALKAQKLERFFTVLNIFFANVPYNIHLKHEKYYQTVFFLIFKLLGLRIDAEVHTNEGRIDAVIELADHIYLFEFKVDGSAEEALQQIKDNDYYQKYRLKSKPIHLIGVNFDSSQRKVSDWRDEREP